MKATAEELEPAVRDAAEAAKDEDTRRWQETARGMAELAERMGDREAADKLRELGDALDDPLGYAAAQQPALPMTVRLVPPKKRLKWADPDEVDEITAEIEGLGYEGIGDFRARPLPVRLRAFCQPSTSSYAVVYEQGNVGVWIDFVTCYRDGGTATFSNAPAGSELPDQPGHSRTFAIDLGATELYERMLAERPDRPLLAVSAGDFAPAFEERYADEMWWRKDQGQLG
ncbi:MAG TPA: hypothetical protein VIL46_04675, partial [Gemmataceae bacterium]